MNRRIENISRSDNELPIFLENRVAALERTLADVTARGGKAEYHAREHGPVEHGPVETASYAPPRSDGRYADSGRGQPRLDDAYEGGYADARADYYADADEDSYADTGDRFPESVPVGYADPPTGRLPSAARSGHPWAGAEAAGAPRQRTEVLINRGRRPVKHGPRRFLAHRRAILVTTIAVIAGATLIAVVLPGATPSWPASVATVEKEITVACQNSNVVSEPSQVNFACAKDTSQILWVFSLLTSGNNPNFADASNGRKGLEPIQPSQGGNIAWSLNLHHPYSPASPIDSLEVAARAINNIIGGATVTGTNGAPVVQQGLESSPANCARYTGSSALITRQGFPAVCALPVSSPDGQAALVSDVFRQWMVGSPAQFATEAGVLFENSDNPGDPRVQSILNTLRTSGL